VEDFVGIKVVVTNLDAGLLLEIGDGVLANVVGPVVDVQDLVFGGLGGRRSDSEGQHSGKQRTAHRGTNLLPADELSGEHCLNFLRGIDVT